MQPVEATPFDREEMLERLGGDTVLLDDVLVVFLEECSKMFEEVRGAVDAGDPRKVHRAAHSRKCAFLNSSACPAAAGGATRLRDVRVLVLGAGGAARSIVGALRELGVRPTLAGRDAGRARAFALELDCDSIEWERIPELDCQVLVNATPVGTGGDGSPVPEHWIPEGGLVLDAVYRPIRTPLLVAAHARGVGAEESGAVRGRAGDEEAGHERGGEVPTDPAPGARRPGGVAHGLRRQPRRSRHSMMSRRRPPT